MLDFSLLPPVSIRAGSRGDRRSRTFPRCSRKSPEYPETDANALMRHLHPRDVTKICRVSLGHYCTYACGADISRPGQEQEEQVEARVSNREVGGWAENRNVLLHDEELINVFQPPRVRARSCVVHRAQRHQPTRPTRAENPCGCRWRGHRGYAFALSLSASVCPCVHRSVQQPCLGLFVGEERYRLVKEGNLLLGSLAKSERSWFVRSRPQRSLLRDDSSNQRYS